MRPVLTSHVDAPICEQDEQEYGYIKRVCEALNSTFLSDRAGDGVPNVAGLVLAGPATIKTQVQRCEVLDRRLASLVVAVVETAATGDAGLVAAADQTRDVLLVTEHAEQTGLLGRFDASIAADNGA